MSNKNFVPRSNGSGSMGEQLRALLPTKGNRQQQHGKGGRDEHQKPMPAPKGKDGVDHINIYEDGDTELGRCLAHSTMLKFSHKRFGPFTNVEAFWHYIRSVQRDDRIRKMSGKALKNFADKMTQRRVVNFVGIILDANWQKVNQYPVLKEAIKQTDLPFECYSCYKRQDGVKIRPNFSYWLIPGFEEIRKALKEGRQPDFTPFLDNPDVDLFDDVIKKEDADIVPASSIASGSVGAPAQLTKTENKELAALLRAATEPEISPEPEPDAPIEAEPVVSATVAPISDWTVITPAESAPVEDTAVVNEAQMPAAVALEPVVAVEPESAAQVEQVAPAQSYDDVQTLLAQPVNNNI